MRELHRLTFYVNTTRYGNKGVISKILPDDEMPFLETGERVDLLFNSLSVINRWTGKV